MGDVLAAAAYRRLGTSVIGLQSRLECSSAAAAKRDGVGEYRWLDSNLYKYVRWLRNHTATTATLPACSMVPLLVPVGIHPDLWNRVQLSRSILFSDALASKAVLRGLQRHT